MLHKPFDKSVSRIKGMLEALLSNIGATIRLQDLLLDEKFGHNNLRHQGNGEFEKIIVDITHIW